MKLLSAKDKQTAAADRERTEARHQATRLKIQLFSAFPASSLISQQKKQFHSGIAIRAIMQKALLAGICEMFVSLGGVY
jgi:hypothetical protein